MYDSHITESCCGGGGGSGGGRILLDSGKLSVIYGGRLMNVQKKVLIDIINP
jgi:hypothetical protein